MIFRNVRVLAIGQLIEARDGKKLAEGNTATHISEVIGMEGDVVTLQNLIVFDLTGADANGKITGVHRSTGIARPRFWERAEYYG